MEVGPRLDSFFRPFKPEGKNNKINYGKMVLKLVGNAILLGGIPALLYNAGRAINVIKSPQGTIQRVDDYSKQTLFGNEEKVESKSLTDLIQECKEHPTLNQGKEKLLTALTAEYKAQNTALSAVDEVSKEEGLGDAIKTALGVDGIKNLSGLIGAGTLRYIRAEGEENTEMTKYDQATFQDRLIADGTKKLGLIEAPATEEKAHLTAKTGARAWPPIYSVVSEMQEGATFALSPSSGKNKQSVANITCNGLNGEKGAINAYDVGSGVIKTIKNGNTTEKTAILNKLMATAKECKAALDDGANLPKFILVTGSKRESDANHIRNEFIQHFEGQGDSKALLEEYASFIQPIDADVEKLCVVDQMTKAIDDAGYPAGTYLCYQGGNNNAFTFAYDTRTKEVTFIQNVDSVNWREDSAAVEKSVQSLRDMTALLDVDVD